MLTNKFVLFFRVIENVYISFRVTTDIKDALVISSALALDEAIDTPKEGTSDSEMVEFSTSI